MRPSLSSKSQIANISSRSTNEPQQNKNETLNKPSNELSGHTSRDCQYQVSTLQPDPPSSSSETSLNTSESPIYGSKEWIIAHSRSIRKREGQEVIQQEYPNPAELKLESTNPISPEERIEERAKSIEKRKGKMDSIAPEDLKTWISVTREIGAHFPWPQPLRTAQPDALTIRLFSTDPRKHLEAPMLCAISKLKSIQWDGAGISAIQFLDICKGWHFTHQLYRGLIAKEIAQLPADGPGNPKYETDLIHQFARLPHLLTFTSGNIGQFWWEFNRPYAPHSGILNNDDLPRLNFSIAQYNATSEPNPFPAGLWRTDNGPPMFNAYELSGMNAKPSQDARQYQREILSISYSVLRRCMGDDFINGLLWRPVYHPKFIQNKSRLIGGGGLLPFAAGQLPRVQVAPEIAVYLAPMKGTGRDFDHREWHRDVEEMVATGVDVRIHPPRYTFVIHDHDLGAYEKEYKKWREAVDALNKVRGWMTQSWANWRAAVRISNLYPEYREWIEFRERLVHDEEIFGLGYTIPTWMLARVPESRTG